MLQSVPSRRPPAPVPHQKPPGALALIRALAHNPLEAWSEAHFTDGIVVTRLPFGRAAVVSEPAAIRRVLVENAANYPKDPLQKRLLFTLAGGLLEAEGKDWEFQRRTLAPLFTRKVVQGFGEAMRDAVDAMLARWDNGSTVDVAAACSLLALDVLERTIFSDGLGNDAREIRTAMRSYFDTFGKIDPFDLAGVPGWVPRLTRLGAGGALREFERATDTLIAQRRSRPDAAPHDLLTLLVQARDPASGRAMTEREIRANIITFMSAGHESTANTIAWTLYLLSVTPEWRARVVEESAHDPGKACPGLDPGWPPVSGQDHAPGKSVTRAVIEETLRLYPPLAAISRVARGPDRLAGCDIPKGTLIVISPYVLHRHRALWARPDEFDPGRFLTGREKIDRFAYMPFGAGARGCIGQVFALQEATIAVTRILAHCDLAVAPGHRVWPMHRITLQPQGGLPMVVRKRARGARIVAAPSLQAAE